MLRSLMLAFLAIASAAAPALAQYYPYPYGGGTMRKTNPEDRGAPPASFTGTVVGVRSKKMTVESLEGNTVEFNVTRKTAWVEGKDKIKPSDLRSGDLVIVEAKKAPDGTLDAVVVHLDRDKPKQPDNPPANPQK